ncbi:hypothetical protein [Candidatus Borrarchaeum sp.]|uniref:hypothetical protein n=1 Tax=Candidatus Borrarchaeum sp. TaxID=2846742 RepID=UPI00257CD563|nr:hypothetical protein [Candidatus Borrarchaeum sp.]
MPGYKQGFMDGLLFSIHTIKQFKKEALKTLMYLEHCKNTLEKSKYLDLCFKLDLPMCEQFNESLAQLDSQMHIEVSTEE